MRSLILAAAALSFGIAASAQAPGQAPSASGSVITATGQAGQVLVARKGQTQYLSANSPLFDGDLVFTNDGGGVTLKFNGCTKTLAPSQSIKIDAKVCDAVPATVSKGQVIGGVTIGETAGLSLPGGAAATAAVAVVVGGAAVAVANGGSSSPTSP